jgi:hypothetical protein
MFFRKHTMNDTVFTKSNAQNDFSWITEEEAIRLLAIGKATIRSYRKNGILPYAQIRGKVYYKIEDLNALLDSCYCSIEETNFQTEDDQS